MGIKGFFSKEEDAKQISLIAKERDGGNCEKCKLYLQKGLITPKMSPHGKFKKELMIWGMNPGEWEDKYGYQFHEKGSSGSYLRKVSRMFDIDIDEDCVKINSCDCRTPDNRGLKDIEIKSCYPRKEWTLNFYKPKAILLLGGEAVESFYNCHPIRRKAISYGGEKVLGIQSLRGKVIPDMELKAWICHSYHPSFIKRGNEDKAKVFETDLALFANCAERNRPNFKDIDPSKIKILTKYRDIINFLLELKKFKFPFYFDYETSSYRYYEGIHVIYLVGIKPLIVTGSTKYISKDNIYILPIEKRDENGKRYLSDDELESVKDIISVIMISDQKKSAQNIKHEHIATKSYFGVDIPKESWDWDTMMGARVMDEAHGVSGLKVQTYINFGYYNYSVGEKFIGADLKEKNKLDELSIKEVGSYCARDCYWGAKLYEKQKRLVKATGLGSAYRLLHNGNLSFADMEMTGIRLDLELANKFLKDWSKEFVECKDWIINSREAKKLFNLKKRHLRFNKQTSRNDLQEIVFNILKIKNSDTLDEGFLSKYREKYEFIDYELKARKVLKRIGSIQNLLKYQVNGFIYPNFLLDAVRSYRSSSNEPNFQNIHKRDPEGAIIRKIIIPREGHLIYEVDYKGMEVRILACWSKDKRLIEFIIEGFDMHGYWAEKIFRIKEKDDKKLFKNLRFAAKNAFVFANFYGSYYESTAKGLKKFLDLYWPNNDVYKNGIQWVQHVKNCEDEFWRMFNGVRKKQMEAVGFYKEHGFLKQIEWGFERHGYLTRNIIFNTHIQGPAFLFLLDSINEIDEVKDKWETVIPGQIHDAIFHDMLPSESDNVMEEVNYIMTDLMREKHDCLIVPLETEWESGSNWYDMKEVEN